MNSSVKVRKRIQVISIEGRLAERYFAVVSEQPRKIVESRISAMPLKGMIDARGRAARLLLLLRRGHGNTVEPCGCGGRRCHGGNPGKMRIENGRKKRQMRPVHNFRKQDADMREPPRASMLR